MKDLLRGHRVALLPAFIKVVVELPLAHEVQQKTVREEREREREVGTEGRQAGKRADKRPVSLGWQHWCRSKRGICICSPRRCLQTKPLVKHQLLS